MKRLPINTFNFIAAIIGAVMTAFMLPMVMLSTFVYYFTGGFLVASNIYGLIQMKKHGGNLRGNILGIIASSCHAITGLLALPAMVLYILTAVFCAKDKVTLVSEEDKKEN